MKRVLVLIRPGRRALAVITLARVKLDPKDHRKLAWAKQTATLCREVEVKAKLSPWVYQLFANMLSFTSIALAVSSVTVEGHEEKKVSYTDPYILLESGVVACVV